MTLSVTEWGLFPAVQDWLMAEGWQDVDTLTFTGEVLRGTPDGWFERWEKGPHCLITVTCNGETKSQQFIEVDGVLQMDTGEALDWWQTEYEGGTD